MYEDNLRKERPLETIKAEDNSIVYTSKRDRRLTAQEITSDFNYVHGKNVSERTIRERLKKAGPHGRVAVRKPLLRSVNRVKRLQ